jgi:hypothetical protein
MAWIHPPTTGALPSARFEQQLTAVGDYLFLFGGGSTFTQQYLNGVHVLDTESLTWGVAPISGKPPKGRCAHSFTTVDKSIIVYGGYDGSRRLKDVKVFSAETAHWITPSKKNKPPGKRAAHVACMLDKMMIVHGGYDGKKRLSDVHMLNTGICHTNDNILQVVETMEWSEPVVSGPSPSPRSYHSACSVGKRMFIFGGYDGSVRSNELFILEESNPYSYVYSNAIFKVCQVWLTFVSHTL